MGDFEVHTNGHCFLCMDKITAQVPTVKVEPRSVQCTYTVHSLQYLSRYLKLDMRKVFDEASVVPPELLAQVDKAKLKVELCEECAGLNESFSKMYRQLEKIEMRTAAYVTLIKSKLMKAKEIQVNEPREVFDGKLKIAKVLRDEAKLKCLYKLKTVGPRIRVETRSIKQLNAQIQEIKVISRNSNETTSYNYKLPDTVENGGVKEEQPESHPSDDDNGDGATVEIYFDESELDYSMQIDGSGLEQPVAGPSESATELTSSNRPKGQRRLTAFDPSNYEIVAGNKFKCKLCFKTFTAKPTWQDHYESVHLNVRYECSLCGMKFVRRFTYKRHHQNIHMGVKFICLVCNKTFSQKGALINHQKTSSCHSGS